MKHLLLSLVVTFVTLSNCFAEQLPPIGLQEMIKALASVSNPAEASGKSFELRKPKNFENFELSLTPSMAFAVSNLKDGTVVVSMAKYTEIYDMELYANTGIVSLKQVGFVWKDGGVINNPDTGDVFQSCSINVVFKINGTILTKKTLDYFKVSNYSIELEYDRNTLEYKGNSDGEFVFKRINNNNAKVNLIVKKPDGSLLANPTSDNLSTCTQSNSTPSKSATWGDWSDWNSCSLACGSGKQSRTRSCLTDNIGVPCIGNAFEEQACNTQSCPPEISADNSCSILMKNAKWNKVSLTKATYRAEYTFTYLNTHPTKNLVCKVHINGVSILDDEVVGVHDTKEHDFNLKPGEQTTLRGELKVKLTMVGTHTGIRDNFLCQYK